LEQNVKLKDLFTDVAASCRGSVDPGGTQMMPLQEKRKLDARPGLANPLGVAISENDRSTMAMVRDAIDARRLTGR